MSGFGNLDNINTNSLKSILERLKEGGSSTASDSALSKLRGSSQNSRGYQDQGGSNDSRNSQRDGPASRTSVGPVPAPSSSGPVPVPPPPSITGFAGKIQAPKSTTYTERRAPVITRADVDVAHPPPPVKQPAIAAQAAPTKPAASARPTELEGQEGILEVYDGNLKSGVVSFLHDSFSYYAFFHESVFVSTRMEEVQYQLNPGDKLKFHGVLEKPEHKIGYCASIIWPLKSPVRISFMKPQEDDIQNYNNLLDDMFSLLVSKTRLRPQSSQSQHQATPVPPPAPSMDRGHSSRIDAVGQSYTNPERRPASAADRRDFTDERGYQRNEFDKSNSLLKDDLDDFTKRHNLSDDFESRGSAFGRNPSGDEFASRDSSFARNQSGRDYLDERRPEFGRNPPLRDNFDSRESTFGRNPSQRDDFDEREPAFGRNPPQRDDFGDRGPAFGRNIPSRDDFDGREPAFGRKPPSKDDLDDRGPAFGRIAPPRDGFDERGPSFGRIASPRDVFDEREPAFGRKPPQREDLYERGPSFGRIAPPRDDLEDRGPSFGRIAPPRDDFDGREPAFGRKPPSRNDLEDRGTSFGRIAPPRDDLEDRGPSFGRIAPPRDDFDGREPSFGRNPPQRDDLDDRAPSFERRAPPRDDFDGQELTFGRNRPLRDDLDGRKPPSIDDMEDIGPAFRDEFGPMDKYGRRIKEMSDMDQRTVSFRRDRFDDKSMGNVDEQSRYGEGSYARSYGNDRSSAELGSRQPQDIDFRSLKGQQGNSSEQGKGDDLKSTLLGLLDKLHSEESVSSRSTDGRKQMDHDEQRHKDDRIKASRSKDGESSSKKGLSDDNLQKLLGLLQSATTEGRKDDIAKVLGALMGDKKSTEDKDFRPTREEVMSIKKEKIEGSRLPAAYQDRSRSRSGSHERAQSRTLQNKDLTGSKHRPGEDLKNMIDLGRRREREDLKTVIDAERRRKISRSRSRSRSEERRNRRRKSRKGLIKLWIYSTS